MDILELPSDIDRSLLIKILSPRCNGVAAGRFQFVSEASLDMSFEELQTICEQYLRSIVDAPADVQIDPDLLAQRLNEVALKVFVGKLGDDLRRFAGVFTRLANMVYEIQVNGKLSVDYDELKVWERGIRNIIGMPQYQMSAEI